MANRSAGLGLGAAGASLLAGLGIYNHFATANQCPPAPAEEGEKSQCQVERDSCKYYLCREEERPCGASGYSLNIGHKFCQAFLDQHFKGFSEEGKTWLSEVRYCLQKRMHEMPVDLSCSELSRRSYDGHYDCYMETGFCQLSAGDKKALIAALGPDAFHLKFIPQGLKVFGSCLLGYAKK